MKEYVQFQDQKITYSNRNQNNTKELKNTLPDKPWIPPRREMDEDGYLEEEVKKSNLIFKTKNISPINLYLHSSCSWEVILNISRQSMFLGQMLLLFLCVIYLEVWLTIFQSDENQMGILEVLINCNSLKEGMALPRGKIDRALRNGVFYKWRKELFDMFQYNVTNLI